jgi:hypothetical protein
MSKGERTLHRLSCSPPAFLLFDVSGATATPKPSPSFDFESHTHTNRHKGLITVRAIDGFFRFFSICFPPVTSRRTKDRSSTSAPPNPACAISADQPF